MPPYRSPLADLQHVETLRKFASELGEGIYITTPAGELLAANPAFLAMFGLRSVDELHKLSTGNFIVDRIRHAEEQRILATEGKVSQFELQLRGADGIVRTVLDTAYVVRDPITGEQFFHGIVVDITTRKLLELELHERSRTDPLTGALNRSHLDVLQRRFSRMPDESWACIFTDVDHFKEINDVHGHRRGDEVLRAVAGHLRVNVREGESVVRAGGDEFAVFLCEIGPEALVAVMRRLESEWSASGPVPISIGCAIRESGESVASLMNRADQELLQRRRDERGIGDRR